MSRPRVVVVGAGFAGIGVAVGAAKAGAEVILLERMNFVVGSGIRAGRMNYNGKLVAAEESKAMGAGDVFEGLESILLHRGNIVDEAHGYVYDARIVDGTMQRVLTGLGVDLRFESRVINVSKEKDVIKSVLLGGGKRVEGDAFVDSSGNTGGIDICTKYGGGCAMCVTHRCPTFGDRVSIATKAGVPELVRVRADGTPGTVEAAISIHKSSLAPALLAQLEKEGAIGIPLPKELIDPSRLFLIGGIRSAVQMEKLNLVDIGITAKCVGNGSLPIEQIRKLPGMEKAMVENPLNVGRGNKINWVSMAPRDDTMKCRDYRNLFVAGQKGGPLGGIAEVIVTGLLAGHNAARAAVGKELLTLPRKCGIGDFIAYTGEIMDNATGPLTRGYSMAHQLYFQRMKSEGLYITDVPAIHRRIKDLGLSGILGRKVA